MPSLQMPTRITLCKVLIVLFKAAIDSSLTLTLCNGGRKGHCGVMIKPSSVIEVELVVDVLIFGAVKVCMVNVR